MAIPGDKKSAPATPEPPGRPKRGGNAKAKGGVPGAGRKGKEPAGAATAKISVKRDVVDMDSGDDDPWDVCDVPAYAEGCVPIAELVALF